MKPSSGHHRTSLAASSRSLAPPPRKFIFPCVRCLPSRRGDGRRFRQTTDRASPGTSEPTLFRNRSHLQSLRLQIVAQPESLIPMPLPVLVAVVIILLYILNSIKILKEYERAVVFRLGRVRHDASGPGIILVFRPIDTIVRVSLRQEAMEVPSQDIITRDNVTLKVNAVITLRVVDPVKA